MHKYKFKNGHTTLLEHIKPDTNKRQRFTIVYAHGFCSDPWGRKPEMVKKWCVEHGCGFVRFEIAGHGSDVDRFLETTIDTYKEQMFEIISDIVEGDVVVMGASLGGWLSLLSAVKFPNRVIGMIGMAAAPDFLKLFFEAYFNETHKENLEKYGKIVFPTNDFSYTITKEMIESAHPNLLLDKETIPYRGKGRLLQGMNDAALYWEMAPQIAKKIESDDVRVVLMKSSNHRLSSDDDIRVIYDMLDDFLV